MVRAAHNRALSEDNSYLKEWLPDQPVKMEVTVELAKSRKPVTAVDLTVAWAMQAVARLGGYLSHRKKSNIGKGGVMAWIFRVAIFV